MRLYYYRFLVCSTHANAEKSAKRVRLRVKKSVAFFLLFLPPKRRDFIHFFSRQYPLQKKRAHRTLYREARNGDDDDDDDDENNNTDEDDDDGAKSDA